MLNNWIKIDAKAPVEETLLELERLLDEGYDTVIFHAEPDSCRICKEYNKEEIPLEDFISDAEYEAPIYTLTHPGCTCKIEVTGFNLDSVWMDYSGII